MSPYAVVAFIAAGVALSCLVTIAGKVSDCARWLKDIRDIEVNRSVREYRARSATPSNHAPEEER